MAAPSAIARAVTTLLLILPRLGGPSAPSRGRSAVHIARIFVDDELKVPVRYAAWNWPKSPGGRPILIEEFTYLDLKLNVGLTDADFDHKNPKYSYR